LSEYIPKQQDILWIDFDPSKGKEIQKKRPAVVVSSSGYIKYTGFVAVCPITNGAKNLLEAGILEKVVEREVQGYVNPLQLHTFDYKQRKVKFIAKMNDFSFFRVKQKVQVIFDE
jgi:mRNA interferase MazF